MEQTDLLIVLAKCVILLLIMLQVAPIMAWVERRGSALMQNRLGPNRIFPLGLLYSVCDAVKFLFKEDRIPGQANRFYYAAAPVVSVMVAMITAVVIPWADTLTWGERVIQFQVASLNVGLLYILSIGSLGVYGIIMAGWASNNKYSLLGSLRSSAQMISYELSLGLSLVGIIMIAGTTDLNQIAQMQGQAWHQVGPLAIPKLGVFVQPLGFLLFLVASYAETNRLPFDLPEGESEIVAGYHLEYGSMRFAMFMMAEYGNMFVASALAATLYFGGWQMLPGMAAAQGLLVNSAGLSAQVSEVLRVLLQVASLFIKIGFFMWLFVWVRWTLPRFRYDQVMDLGWKVMLPLSLVNIFITGVLVYLKWV